MTLRIAYAGLFVAFALLAFAVVLGNQRQAFADANVPPVPADPCKDVFPQIPNMSGCDEDSGGGNDVPPADPCDDVFPQIPNIPECDDDGGGGGGDGIDVCPNIDGLQTEVPDGKVLEGGECIDAPSNGGGGDGGGSTDASPIAEGGSGGGCPPYANPCTSGYGGLVLGTTTATTTTATTTPGVLPSAPTCDAHITTFIRMGQANDPEEVKRMQSILKNFEGMDVEETGEYDAKSVAAIYAFQLKYANEILIPWGIEEPTGYVFLTTRKKLNEIYCRNTITFPLTTEEQQHIELVKQTVATPKPAAPAAPTIPAQPKQPETPKTTTTISTKEPSTPVTGNRISDFFRRLFDRLR